YIYDGETRYHFNDAKERKAGGSKGCSHEWWHAYRPEKDNKQLRAHAHMKLREVAYFLQLLDREEMREANGKSVLQNSLITVSTESGDGRHNDVKRELSGVFHAVTEANGRFQTGEIMDVNAEGIDIYNTILDGFGSVKRLGKDRRGKREVSKIRA
ncbi:MAG: hypothetical protein AAF226_01950, partial [Verrucomicrobiota bacterium]